jgi:hypothetical protein
MTTSYFSGWLKVVKKTANQPGLTVQNPGIVGGTIR